MHPSARVLDWKSSTSATQSEASALAGIFDQLLLARGSGAGTVAGTVPGPSAGSRRDAELRELAAELEASEAKRKVEAKRKRPIRIARFEV
jgi:hypothetical protein